MSLTIETAIDRHAWDAFLTSQCFSPFLQSWAMSETYRDCGQEPIRLIAKKDATIVGICFAHLVPARRGRHLAVPYGPVTNDPEALSLFIEELKRRGKELNCAFVRLSPFWPLAQNERNSDASTHNPSLLLPVGEGGQEEEGNIGILKKFARSSPLHLLAEHVWYLPLKTPDPWTSTQTASQPRSEAEIFKDMRSTARNLIRRAEKESVTVEASMNPVNDLEHFLALHDETRRRHGFVPYTNAFFRAQVTQFAKENAAILYLARYQGEVIAASIHIRFGGETSYHHGASTQKYKNIPASYLLQWTAIRDALKRGDDIYNFWGVSPEGVHKHPFAGVRTFKTAFGGQLLPLVHCMDLPLSPKYFINLGIETVRKWRRGF